MNANELKNLPHMLYADREGKIYDHPYLRMAGFSGLEVVPIQTKELIPMPELSKLFFIPDCPPMGLDPSTGEYRVVPEIDIKGKKARCYGVAAFLEPGIVRSQLPAVDYGPKTYTLPTWAYTAVGFKKGTYWAAGFEIEYNHRWDPRNYDDRELLPAIEAYESQHKSGPLVDHLINCATNHHCFAAKNLFLGRWEAPLPLSRGCNAECLGCLSLQPERSFEASHNRIDFKPSREEIVTLAVRHLNQAKEGIVSFGQGCEGEPLTEYELIADSIREIRRHTENGTINLNTNGSWPDRVRLIAESGLDAIRISLNSARPEFYNAYYRPRDYGFSDVEASITLSTEMGLYTMLNYLVFPGITDQEEEVEALKSLIKRTNLNFVHLKNLNIDPKLYVDRMPKRDSPVLGIKKMVDTLKATFPNLELGYFNQAVR